MKARRILSFSLALILIFTVISGTLEIITAKGYTNISVEDLTAKRGEVITVSVMAENIEGAKNLNFDLNYDSNVIEYIPGSFKPSENISRLTNVIEAEDGLIMVSIAENGRKDWNIEKGVLATFDFKVSEDALKITYIHINNSRMVDRNGDLVSILQYYGAVEISIPVEEISFRNENISIIEGISSSLIYDIIPADAEEDLTFNLLWSSSDETIATVNKYGIVTANSLGNTIITVKSQNGIESTCNITVIAERASIFPIKEISMTGGDENVVEEIELNIPGPFPVTWSAYSNDAFIYLEYENRYTAVHTMTSEEHEFNKLKIICNAALMPQGTYMGTVTVVLGDISENILIIYTKTTTFPNGIFTDHDPFYENPFRVNLALGGIATASSTFVGPYEVTNPSYTINGEIQWPRWASVDGVWEPNTTVHWLTVDLKERKSFDKIILYFLVEKWAIIKDFKVLASNSPESNNPDDWYEIISIKNNTQEMVTIDFEEITYRYVRLYITEAVQDRAFKNCARVTQFKILSKTEYPKAENMISLRGDVNNDKSVTITDAIAIFRHLADKVKITNSEAVWAADVDSKDGITIQDAIYIFRYLADKMTLEQLQALT